jgi:solute carrier family 35 (UDP-sugar transporter), member A1/2/3
MRAYMGGRLTRRQILTTALFTVTMLGRSLSFKRWVSLLILTLGVSIVSIPTSNSKDGSFLIHDMTDHFFPRSVHELGQMANGMGDVARELTKRTFDGLADVGEALTKRSATYEGIEEDQNLVPLMNYSIGLTAVVIAAIVSGLTGVYFEKVLKDPASPASVWTRNIQLSFYSLFPALFIGIFFKDGNEIAKHGFFDGYNWVVWTLILLQAFGGVLASLCINYADNIAKNFATSISIVISFIFSVFFFNVQVSLMVSCCRQKWALAMIRLTYDNSSLLAQSWLWCRPICTLVPSASEAGRHQLTLSISRRPRSTR